MLGLLPAVHQNRNSASTCYSGSFSRMNTSIPVKTLLTFSAPCQTLLAPAWSGYSSATQRCCVLEGLRENETNASPSPVSTRCPDDQKCP